MAIACSTHRVGRDVPYPRVCVLVGGVGATLHVGVIRASITIRPPVDSGSGSGRLAVAATVMAETNGAPCVAGACCSSLLARTGVDHLVDILLEASGDRGVGDAVQHRGQVVRQLARDNVRCVGLPGVLLQAVHHQNDSHQSVSGVLHCATQWQSPTSDRTAAVACFCLLSLLL